MTLLNRFNAFVIALLSACSLSLGAINNETRTVAGNEVVAAYGARTNAMPIIDIPGGGTKSAAGTGSIRWVYPVSGDPSTLAISYTPTSIVYTVMQSGIFTNGYVEFSNPAITNNPTFRIGQVYVAGDGSNAYKTTYLDDVTPERIVTSVDD